MRPSGHSLPIPCSRMCHPGARTPRVTEAVMSYRNMGGNKVTNPLVCSELRGFPGCGILGAKTRTVGHPR